MATSFHDLVRKLNEAPIPPAGGDAGGLGGPPGGGLGDPMGGGLGGMGGPPPMGGGGMGGLGGPPGGGLGDPMGGGLGGMGGGGDQQPVPVKFVAVMDVWKRLTKAYEDMDRYKELTVGFDPSADDNEKKKPAKPKHQSLIS